MTSDDREKLDRLIRRRDHLIRRISVRKKFGQDAVYDEAERTALDWAIEIVTDHLGLDVRVEA